MSLRSRKSSFLAMIFVALLAAMFVMACGGGDDVVDPGINVDDEDPVEDPVEDPAVTVVAYYPFNGNANDESSYFNHGTVYGATLTVNRSGTADSAYSFDGLSYIEAANDTGLNTISSTRNMTIAAWVKVEGWSDSNIWFPVAEIEDGWTFHLQNPDIAGLSLGFSITGEGTWASPTISMNVWHHVAASYNDSTDTVVFYVDGVNVATNSLTKPMPTYYGPLEIGFSPYGSDDYAIGSIDNVRIWNVVLDDSEVQAVYESTAP